MPGIRPALFKPEKGAYKKVVPMSDCCHPFPRDGLGVAVISAASAGLSASISAADLGTRVALVGLATFGGTSVNLGGVPSKTLTRAAEAPPVGPAARRFPGLGGSIHLEDGAALAASKGELIAGLSTCRQDRNAKGRRS